MEEELDVVLKKIISRKAASLDKILHKVWKTRKFDDSSSSLIMQLCVFPKLKKEMDKRLLPFFPKEGDLGITKNYEGKTLIAIAARLYKTSQLYET